MTVELRPLNVLCNIQCHYCYQEPQRDAGYVKRPYDMDKMKRAIEKEGQPFAMFGGEPLLVPMEDLEALWSWGLERFGFNSLQTNGTLITDEHIALFKKYRVGVGISIDGPGELNDVRWHGTVERTRRSTEHTVAAIRRLCEEKIPPSLIIVLTRSNAAAGRIGTLVDWVREIASAGVRDVRLHLLESENDAIRGAHGMTTEENIAALMAFLELDRHAPPGLKIDPFVGLRRLLVGDDRKTTCVWHACDPYTTRAVRGVEGQGQRTNCGRTNKDGVDFVKAEAAGYERYAALYHTPQDAGGCADCRFFMMCKGQCPGTAISGDWRNRSEHCDVWKALLASLERELLDAGQTPLSVRDDRLSVERFALERWSAGQMVSMAAFFNMGESQRPTAPPIPTA
jgi:uncharacterized protein